MTYYLFCNSRRSKQNALLQPALFSYYSLLVCDRKKTIDNIFNCKAASLKIKQTQERNCKMFAKFSLSDVIGYVYSSNFRAKYDAIKRYTSVPSFTDTKISQKQFLEKVKLYFLETNFLHYASNWSIYINLKGKRKIQTLKSNIRRNKKIVTTNLQHTCLFV